MQETLVFRIQSGQIEGYFNGRIPEGFWKLYAVYVGMTVFSSVVWTLRAAPHMLDDTLERLTVVLEDRKDFELLKPIWFQPEKIDIKIKGRCDRICLLFLPFFVLK
ncbi:hypothetical protein ACT7DA_15555 [Bacillus pacificus]